MKNIVAIFLKELKSHFYSLVAWIIISAFLVITSYFFIVILIYSKEASMRYSFTNMSIILLFLTPAFTMRLFSEEKKSGTIEILMTCPVRDGEVVLGKYLASFFLFLVMIGLTLQYPYILKTYGKPDFGPIISGYLGIILLGGAFLSVGIFVSSLTENQIVSAIVSFGILLIFWFIEAFSSIVGTQGQNIISYISLSEHFYDFTKGIIDLKSVVFYLSFIAFFIFLTIRSVEARKWR